MLKKIAVLAWAGLMTLPAFGGAYKCPQADGRIVYQQQPCTGGQAMDTPGISEARRLEAAADTTDREARELSDQSMRMKADGFPISMDEIVKRRIKMEGHAKEMREQAKALREADRAVPKD